MKLYQRIIQAKCAPVPKGWLTLEALAKQDGVASAQGTFTYQVKAAVALGILEQSTFRVPRANGIRPVAHYRYTRKARRAA